MSQDVLTEKRIEEIARSLGKFLEMQKSQASGDMSQEEKAKLFKAIATDDQARKDYAASRADVLLKQLKTQATVRSIFKPTVLNGSQPSFPIDWDNTQVAYIASTIGGQPHALYEGDEIYIPAIELTAGVDFLKKYARDGRFDIGERATDILKNKLMAKEEFVGWRTAKATISGVLTAQTVYTGGLGSAGNLFGELTLSGVNLMYTRMDTYERQMTDLYVTPIRYGDIRNWTTTAIDYFTQREIFKLAGPANGQIYDVALHKVYNTVNLINDGEAFGFDTSRFGIMAIHSDLETVEDPTLVRERKIGLLAFEEVGFAVMDSWAIVRMRLDAD